MTTPLSPNATQHDDGLAWPAALAATTTIGSLVAVCMMPFVALAVMVAATMPLRRSVATILAIWAANQIIGFGLLGYPQTAVAIVNGLALAVAALTALAVARRTGISPGSLAATQIAVAFALSFAAYELVLLAVAAFTGGLATFAAPIVLQIALSELAWLACLLAFCLLLRHAAPHTFGPVPMLRLA